MGGSFSIRYQTAKLWKNKKDARGIGHSEHLNMYASFLFQRSAATSKLAQHGSVSRDNLITLRRRLGNANSAIMCERELEFYGLITLRRTRRWYLFDR